MALIDSYGLHVQTSQKKTEATLETKEKYRESLMQRLLILSLIKRHFSQIEVEKLVKFNQKENIFNALLNVLSRKSFCPNCQFC